MEAKKIKLEDMLKSLRSGEIQLPDFQRDWIWDDEKIKSLLESVIRDFPINSIMLLECNPDDTKFFPRPIAGVDKSEVTAKPQALILDGQQRLTSLFGALFSDKPVTITKGKTEKNFLYYVDMAKAIDVVKNSVDAEDMIISVPLNRKLKTKGKTLDLSTPEKEFAASMFPLKKIFEGNMLDWIFGYTAHYDNDPAKQNFVMEFNNCIKKVSSYEVAIIRLEKDISLAAVCKIFENANKGIAKLEIFDLLTSIFAAIKDADGNPIKLREDWRKIHAGFDESGLSVLHDVNCTDFVTAVTLLTGYRSGKKPVSCKPEDVLRLDYADYLRHRDDIIGGFVETGKFLAEEGISTTKYLPYSTQLVPMAALFAELKLSGKNNAAARNKIRQWYWFSVFNETYRDGSRTRSTKDFLDVMNRIDTDAEPNFFRKTDMVTASKLMKLKSTSSAAYKGLIAVIFKNGAKDFLAGRNMRLVADFADSIEIHHIFPKKYCVTCNLSKDCCESVANKTLIMRATNKVIGSNPPSVYLQEIQRRTGLNATDVDGILEGHFIDAELCRADDFQKFIVDRAKKILDAVENLTGRKVSGRDSSEIKKLFGTTL